MNHLDFSSFWNQGLLLGFFSLPLLDREEENTTIFILLLASQTEMNHMCTFFPPIQLSLVVSP